MRLTSLSASASGKPGLGDDAVDEVVPAGGDQTCGVVQDLVPPLRVEALALERGARAANRTVDLFARRPRGHADLFAGELVEHRDGLDPVHPGAVHEEGGAPLHRRCWGAHVRRDSDDARGTQPIELGASSPSSPKTVALS